MTEQVEVQAWHPPIQSSEGAPDFTWGPPDEHGLRHPVPTVGEPVERGGVTWPSQSHLDSHVAALKRELAGVQARIEHIRTDADLFASQRPRTEEDRAYGL